MTVAAFQQIVEQEERAFEGSFHREFARWSLPEMARNLVRETLLHRCMMAVELGETFEMGAWVERELPVVWRDIVDAAGAQVTVPWWREAWAWVLRTLGVRP